MRHTPLGCFVVGYLAALGSVSEWSCKGLPSGAMTDGNRPVRNRMPGGVGGAGSIPVPTRFGLVDGKSDMILTRDFPFPNFEDKSEFTDMES